MSYYLLELISCLDLDAELIARGLELTQCIGFTVGSFPKCRSELDLIWSELCP